MPTSRQVYCSICRYLPILFIITFNLIIKSMIKLKVISLMQIKSYHLTHSFLSCIFIKCLSMKLTSLLTGKFRCKALQRQTRKKKKVLDSTVLFLCWYRLCDLSDIYEPILMIHLFCWKGILMMVRFPFKLG